MLLFKSDFLDGVGRDSGAGAALLSGAVHADDHKCGPRREHSEPRGAAQLRAHEHLDAVHQRIPRDPHACRHGVPRVRPPRVPQGVPCTILELFLNVKLSVKFLCRSLTLMYYYYY